MKHEIKKLGKAQVELNIFVEPADYKDDLEKAAARISDRASIKGFRQGKAPYNIVKEQVGEIKIFEEAMQSIVEKNLFAVIKKENLETVGTPQITIEKIAPGNDFVFKAVASLMPKIKLCDLNKIKVEIKTQKTTDKETEDIVQNLRKMQAKEILKNGTAEKEDKIVIDLDMFLDKVPVEGGQAKNHQVYLNEPNYIPGMAEQLVGLKKGDTKEFTLKFPKEHYQKHLAGRDIDLKTNVKDVYKIEYPEVNDEFAKTLGQENADKLKERIAENLTKEKETREDQRVEIEMLEKIVAGSEFEVIPDSLIDYEKQKMFHELKHDLEQRGITIEKYLTDIKKTEKEIFDDFAAQADKRVKAALVSRQVALDNDIKVEKADLDKEIELIKTSYAGDKTVEENLKRPEVIDTIASTVQNRKVIAWLKTKICGQNK
ncbi:MAG: trigger factor [Patescibacteria group bacterium]